MKKTILILFSLLFLVSCGNDTSFTSNNSSHLVSSTEVLREIKKIEFMWEIIDIDKYPFFRERLEREFYIVADNTTQFKLWVKRTGKYFPIYEKELQKAWLPDDLKYLSVAESFLLNDAYSRVWASWLWQFMPATARQYGLIVDDYVDERNNYKKATDSAISYLKYLWNLFEWDFKLALSAYNKWENALRRTIERQGTNNYFELLLNSETRRFVPRILAIKIAFENREKLWLNLNDSDYYSFPDYKIIEVDEIDDFYDFARNNNTSIYDFMELNPWLNLNKNMLPKRQSWWLWEVKVLK